MTDGTDKAAGRDWESEYKRMHYEVLDARCKVQAAARLLELEANEMRGNVRLQEVMLGTAEILRDACGGVHLNY